MLSRLRRSTTTANTVGDIDRRETKAWWSWYGLLLLGTLFMAYIASKTMSRPFSVAFLLLMIVVALCVVRPVLGLYVVVFLIMLGDDVTAGWYPFNRNLSAAESILYISNQLVFSPLELCLAALTLGWLFQMMARRQFQLERGQLLGPILVFTGFLLFGFVNGVARGGNLQAAWFEIRALVPLPLVYVLLTNLFTRKNQYQALYWLIMIAVFVNSLNALWYLQSLPVQVDGSETPLVHGTTLPMNAMIVLIAAAWMLRGGSSARRLLLPIMAIPVVIVYFLSERRAAVVALIGGLLMFGVFLFWMNRRAFWRIAPVVLVFGTIYTAAFWNDSTTTVGFPAQAIKSVIAPDQVSERNQNSDRYRVIEKIDIVATIKSSPVTGIGFGHPFLRPIPLPTITAFLLEPYMPHNSILWIWMKTGIAGFIAMLFLFAKSMRVGARASLQAQRGDFAAVTFTSVAFVLMYAVFAYVDIAWDVQNVVFLGVALAVIGSAARLRGDASKNEPTPHEVETAAPQLADAHWTAPVESFATHG